ncbi:MAG: lantibiotic ABC transporter, partial [Hymenobacter sp.]
MKLKTVKLQNFRSYKDEAVVCIDDLTALVGQNDAGKSTVLEALEIFFNNTLIKIESADAAQGGNATDVRIS